MSTLDKVLALSKDVSARYDDRDHARQAAREQIEAGNILLNDEEQVKERLQRLNYDPETYEPIVDWLQDDQEGDEEGLDDVIDKGIVGPDPESFNALERILGFNNLISVNFLEQGWRAARAVGRIHISRGLGFGTGFMISPRLLLTNNHVLEDEGTADLSIVEFDYQLGADGRRLRTQEFSLRPDELFITNKELDFTLVAVEPINEKGIELASYGWLGLIVAEGKVIKGELLNIIQHPGGERKQIALRENFLEDILENYLHYKTDTAPGSSGAPVFNDQWEVVALHHAGVPKMDDDGNLLALDGSIWTDDMRESQLAWIANEGVRISRIIKAISEQDLDEAAAALWQEAQDGGIPPLEASPVPAAGPARMIIPQSTRAQVTTAVAQDTPPELAGPLSELAEFDSRPYYDELQDKGDRDTYYGDMAAAEQLETAFEKITSDGWHITVAREVDADSTKASAAPTFEQLHDLLLSTHANEPRYEPTKFVYPWVDLHEDAKIRSIYSGKVYDPQTFINEDFAIEKQRVQQLRAYRAREAAASEAAIASFEALLEAQLPYNCEHVVPQSWFGKKEPMRGDIHHLFACESGCNSFRSNIPYFDFEDFGEATRSECGKRLGNKFEPDAGKGAIARAVFYFLVRYPGLINDEDNEFQKERLPFLLAWHARYPVTDYERHRNMAIFQVQGNRNPFIDYPQWVSHVDLTQGFG